MGEDKKQSNYVALVTCAACMLFTLVTCSFVLAQYSRWQSELTDLKVQIVKAVPMCSPSGKEEIGNAANDESLVLDSSSTNLESRPITFKEPSSSSSLLLSRLRRSVGESEEGTGGRKQKGRGRKNGDSRRQDTSATHFFLTTGTQTPLGKKSKNLRAIQFHLDADKYKNITDGSRMTIIPWWNPEEWCQGRRSDLFQFDYSTGKLTIRQDGLYYVYAQITYKNSDAMNGFDVKINDGTALISCTQERRLPAATTPSPVVDNCHVASVAHLSAGQTLSIWNAVSGYFFRRMEAASGATFWGVMRIGHS